MNFPKIMHNKKNILIGLFFLAVFFPFVTPVRASSDIQPWALLLAVILVITLIFQERKKFFASIPKPLLVLFAIFFYACLLFVLQIIKGSVDYFAGLRSLWDYSSLTIITYAGFRFWQKISVKLYIASMCAWFTAALAQLVFGAGILARILPRFAGGGFRGMTSFAPEPAFYGMICVYFLTLNEFFYKEKKYNTLWYFLIIVGLLLQIIISYSGVGMLLVVLFGFGKGLEFLFTRSNFGEKKKQVAVILLCIASVSIFFFNKRLSQTRAGSLLHASVGSPQDIVSNDTSVANRFINPFVANYGGIVQAKGAGVGIGSKDEVPLPDKLAEIYSLKKGRVLGNTIEGGLVQSIYQLGIVGFVYVAAVWFIIFKAIGRSKELRGPLIICAVAIFLPITIFGSIANPMIGLLLGVTLSYAYKNESIGSHSGL